MADAYSPQFWPLVVSDLCRLAIELFHFLDDCFCQPQYYFVHNGPMDIVIESNPCHKFAL